VAATTASGKGRILGMAEWGDDDLIIDVERPTPPVSAVVADWFWAGGPPDVTVIPWTWLQVPLKLRADQPMNVVEITRVNQAAALATNEASRTTNGTFPAKGTLDTIIPDDAYNYAAWLVTYYANPLLRAPVFSMPLQFRTVDEVPRILGRTVGDRFTLGPSTVRDGSGAVVVLPVPAGLPAGAQSLVISGIAHTSSVTDRVVSWTTAPLLGSAPGVEGPWFRIDSSMLDGTDQRPF